MEEARISLTKEEANIVLAALEMHADVHDAIAGGLGHRSYEIMDKIIDAGTEAGWEEKETPQVVSKTVDVVRTARGEAFTEAPGPSPFEE